MELLPVPKIPRLSKKQWRKMTDEEKLAYVHAVIERDAIVWKNYVTANPWDWGYYVQHSQDLALTERMR